MTSRLSLSTQRNALKMGSHALPTSYQLASAKRRLYQFIDTAISQSYERANLDLSPAREEALHLWRLPLEIVQLAMQFMSPAALVAAGATCKSLYAASCLPHCWAEHNKDLISSLQISGIYLAPSNLQNARKIFLSLYKFGTRLSEAVEILQGMNEEVESVPSLRSSGGACDKEEEKTECVLKRKERLEEIFTYLGMDRPWNVSVQERLERDLTTFSEKPESSKVDLSWAFLSESCLCLHLQMREGFYRCEGPMPFHIHFSPYSYLPPTIHSLSSTLYHPFINNKGEVSIVKGSNLIMALVDLFINPEYLTSYFAL